MDVARPMIVCLDTPLSDILREASAPNSPQGRTPLSFLNRKEWVLSQFWAYHMQILRKLKLVPRQKAKPTEADHFSSIQFLEIGLKWEVMFGWLITAYSAIFMAAWTFVFPTYLEHTLWRAASIYCLVYGIIGSWLSFLHQHGSLVHEYWSKVFEQTSGMKRDNTQSTSKGDHGCCHVIRGWKLLRQFPSATTTTSQWFDWMRNLSSSRDPALAIPVRLWIPTTALCCMYCFSRAYILAEDFAGLRALPASAYETVNWSQYSPIL